MKSVLISRASVQIASALGFFMHNRLRVFIFSKLDIVSSVQFSRSVVSDSL